MLKVRGYNILLFDYSCRRHYHLLTQRRNQRSK